MPRILILPDLVHIFQGPLSNLQLDYKFSFIEILNIARLMFAEINYIERKTI